MAYTTRHQLLVSSTKADMGDHDKNGKRRGENRQLRPHEVQKRVACGAGKVW